MASNPNFLGSHLAFPRTTLELYTPTEFSTADATATNLTFSLQNVPGVSGASGASAPNVCRLPVGAVIVEYAIVAGGDRIADAADAALTTLDADLGINTTAATGADATGTANDILNTANLVSFTGNSASTTYQNSTLTAMGGGAIGHTDIGGSGTPADLATTARFVNLTLKTGASAALAKGSLKIYLGLFIPSAAVY